MFKIEHLLVEYQILKGKTLEKFKLIEYYAACSMFMVFLNLNAE